MAIQGLRHTDNFVTDERPRNWREAILILEPNGDMPITALTSQMRSERTTDPEFNWWEKPTQSMRLELTVDIDNTAGDNVLTFDSGANQLKAGSVLFSEETEEVMFVTADPGSDTSVTVERGFAGTTKTSIDVDASDINPNFFVTGTAYEEGSSAPTPVQFDPTKVTNFTQIFRDTIEFTRTALKTRLRTGDQAKEAKRESLGIHGLQMERAFLFGASSEGFRNGKPQRTTKGITRYLTTGNGRRVNLSAALDMVTFEEHMKTMFSFGSSEKMGFLGNRALLTIQQVVRKNTSYQIFANEKEFGMNVTRITTPFGNLVLRTHKMFNQLTSGTNSGANDYNAWEANMLVLDMANIRYRYIDDTRYEAKIQANGVDGMQSGWLTEAGLELHHLDTHFLLTNMSSAAAD